jgi:riboflavin kinase / FMN adenylyltransferase
MPSPTATVFVRDGDPVPPALRGAIVAIGNFDGVHRGHQSLIDAAREHAARLGRPAAVLTFEPHPRSFFAPDKPLFRLTPEPVKLAILRRLGLEAVFVRRFDADLAATPARAFVEDLLVGTYGAAGVVVGPDFHFGRGREGTPARLQEWAPALGLLCEILPPVREGDAPVSSSAVRRALAAGEVRAANGLLGYRWFVEGEVAHGDKRGRTLGFPTANLRLPPGTDLRHGIYAVRAALGPEVREGVASYGRRPTFDDGPPLLETYLFDFAGDLYGRTLRIEFVGFIRPEERFASVDALVLRMGEDERRARAVLAAPGDEPSLIG